MSYTTDVCPEKSKGRKTFENTSFLKSLLISTVITFAGVFFRAQNIARAFEIIASLCRHISAQLSVIGSNSDPHHLSDFSYFDKIRKDGTRNDETHFTTRAGAMMLETLYSIKY